MKTNKLACEANTKLDTYKKSTEDSSSTATAKAKVDDTGEGDSKGSREYGGQLVGVGEVEVMLSSWYSYKFSTFLCFCFCFCSYWVLYFL
jgi:hypothetical protein